MKLQALFYFLLCWCFFLTTNAIAQNKTYTDYKPVFTPKKRANNTYIIDKIVYTKKHTIIHFRFVCDNTLYAGSSSFHPKGAEYAWYLKGKNVRKDFDLESIRNVYRNGKLVKDKVIGNIYYSPLVKEVRYTIYSCEIYFPRLPSDVKVVDLIEGRGQENNKIHFNFFDIKLKTWEDDLGSEKDTKDRINQFKNQYREEGEEEISDVTQESTEEVELKTNAPTSLTKIDDIECGKRLLLEDIHFQDNSTNYNGTVKARRTIQYITQYLQQNPNATVKLHGYTDVFGDKEQNLELSRKRVIRIQRLLSMKGINHKRISYEAHGSDNPLVPEGDISNRRVEVQIDCM